MTNEAGGNAERRFDLEERTARFGEAVIGFAKGVSVGPVTDCLIRQLVRAATSVGANYCISVCKRESRESKHWLRMIASAVPEHKDGARKLWTEAKELNLIFSAIYRGKKKE
ncbi:MAG: hypothetical protein ACOCWL_02205 [Thermoguttaceae bacterium]